MNLVSFKNYIEKLRYSPIPGRHLYIWHGSLPALLNFIPRELLLEFDLLDIIEKVQPDVTDEQIKSSLKQFIIERLRELNVPPGKQGALVITNNLLLARYNIPLTIFYDYFICDRTCVILHIGEYYLDNKLPNYIIFEPRQILKYFASLAGEENVIAEEES